VMLEDGPMHVRSFLRMMQFADATADTRIGKLSGGERNRVQLARLLRRGGNLLVLDEPTNDLDLLTLGSLEEALCAFPGCVIVVSHDRWFLDRVATGILAFEGDGKVVFHEGDYSAYEARKKADEAERASVRAERGAQPRVEARTARVRERKLTFKEKDELSKIEAIITAAEAKVAALEATLSDPAVFKERAADVPAIVASLDAARAEVARLYDRWSELDAIAAASPT
jgi:ATP-binding cassette subfamily F protein uup